MDMAGTIGVNEMESPAPTVSGLVGAEASEPDTTTSVGANASLKVPRRRCYDEAFASSESGSATPEPEDELSLGNVGEVDVCLSTTTTEGRKSGTSGDANTRILCEAHPGCFKTFASVREYEDHYNLRHRHKCSTCKKSLPSAHILELHVLEAHDTLFSLMAERKPMLACYMESCSSKFSKIEERKEHCLSEHKFPKSFRLWDLTGAPTGNRQEKKSGPRPNAQGKEGLKQKNEKHIANSKSEKMQGGDDSSTINEVTSSSDSLVVTPAKDNLLPNVAMEMDPPQAIQKTKNPMKKSSSKPKPGAGVCEKESNLQKVAPVQITFGRSASRTFKPRYAFGLAKPARGENTVVSSSDGSKMDLDLSDIRDVLPEATETETSLSISSSATVNQKT